MFGSLPGAAKALLWVRVLNQLGAYALGFLAVLAGPELAPAALAVFGVAALVSRWGGAILLDWLSPRVVVAGGLGATGLALTVLLFARSPVQLLVAVALVGLAFEIYEPASQEMVAQVTEGEQRQRMYGLLGGSLVAAGAVAGVIAAVLLPLGVRWLLVADALTCAVAAWVALRFLPGGLRRSGAQDPAGDGGVRGPAGDAGAQGLAGGGVQGPVGDGGVAGTDGVGEGRHKGWGRRKEWEGRRGWRGHKPWRGYARWGGRTRWGGRKGAGRRREWGGRREGRGRGGWWPPAVLVRFTVAGTVFAVGYLAVMMFLPLVLLERGAQAWVPGVVLTGAALLAPVALWATRRVLGGTPHRLLLGWGTLALGVLALVMAGAAGVPLTVGAYLAWTAVNGVLLGRWQAMVADAAPEDDRPRWFAFHGSSWGIAQPAVPGLVALAGVVAGAGAAFLTAGVAFLLVPPVLHARRTGRRAGRT
ncbi:MFS transporter [Microtetraspora sp. NBRC 13810]|uniref:MFS transporter n=1 Tax=Microtetraspora sp. NBRC 13810 TaxID=3030990 RepID=UPI002554DBDC|nr:MFS transporter [Microtetraspora sp. NBRC 13810]